MEIKFLDSDIIVDDSEGGRPLGGTNGAKLYSHLGDAGGQQYCIKFYNSEREARNEVLTAELYALAGVNVAKVYLVRGKDNNNKKYGVASKYSESFKTAQSERLSDELKHEACRAFAIDAWLNNWDVVGLEQDNIGTCEKGDKDAVMRLDYKGGLDCRAMDTRSKTETYGVEAFDPVVRSLTSLLDKKVNAVAAKFFSTASEEDIKFGIEKLAQVSEKAIHECVMQYGYGTEEDKLQLSETLLARRKYLMMRYFVFKSEISKGTEFEEIANLIVKAFYREVAEGDDSYKKFIKPGQLNDKGIEHIKRVKHGGMHASRVAALANVFFNIYKIYDTRTDLLDDEKSKMLMITAMFHDAGRRCDTGNDCDEDEERSAQLAEKCLLALGYDENLSHVISLAIKYKDRKGEVGKLELPKLQDPANTENKGYAQQLLEICIDLLHDADCLDVLRDNDWVFNPKYLTFYQKFIKARREAAVEREKQNEKHYKEFIDHTEKRLDEIIEAHANALVSMGDCPQGYEDREKGIDIPPSFSLETKAIYEHADRCYSDVATELCRQPGLAKSYTEFVSFRVQKEGEAYAGLGKKVVKGGGPVRELPLLAVNYVHYLPNAVSGKVVYYDDVGRYFADEPTLAQKGFGVRENVLVMRGDKRPSAIIKAMGAFNPWITVHAKTEVNLNYERAGVLDVIVHRGDVVGKDTGFVSASFFDEVRWSYNRYLAFAPNGLACVRKNSQDILHSGEHELSVPGGIEWGDVIAYRDKDSKYIYT